MKIAKQYILQLVLIFLPLLGIAQIDYSFDLVSSIDQNKIGIGFIPEFKTQYNYRVGGNFNARITGNLFIKSGLRYAEISTKVRTDDIRWPSEIGPDGFEPDPSLPRYLEYSWNWDFIELPLVFRYQIGDKKLSTFVEIGISPHIYLNTNHTISSNLNTESNSINEIERGDSRIRRTLVISFGMNYNLSDKVQLFVQPILRKIYYNFARNHTQSLIAFNSDIRNIGIEFGIRRGFRFTPKKKAND